MRFHVLGIGPVGSLVSHHLRQALPSSHPITLIHKYEKYARLAAARTGNTITVEACGLSTTSTGFQTEAFQSASPPSRASLGDAYDIESLFVTTKAYSILPAISRLQSRLSSNSTIVLLSNGMGIYEQLVKEVFPTASRRPHFILATNTHGTFLRDSTVVHAGMGEINFALVPDPAQRNYEAGFNDHTLPSPERLPRLSDITTPDDPHFARYRGLRNTVAALLMPDSLQARWRSMHEHQHVMRRKLVVNAIVNPLTAVLGCRNGDLLNSPGFDTILTNVCTEASKLFAAELRANISDVLEQLDANGMDLNAFMQQRLHASLQRDALKAEVLRVIEATRENISSTLEDVRRGRRHELGYVNGYLMDLARQYKLHVPTIHLLYQLVRMRTDIPIDQTF